MVRKIDPAPLTPRQLQEYKEWLADLAAEAAETGDYAACDPEVWEYFDPKTSTGEQILASLSERELFAPVLATMDRPGHTPQFDQVYVIYRRYLAWRYGAMNAVKFRARTLYKRNREEMICPPGWQERVSAEALLTYCSEQEILVTERDRNRLAALCASIKEKGTPVITSEVSSETRGFLNELAGDWRKAFAIMGIPLVTKQQMPSVQRGIDKRKKGL